MLAKELRLIHLMKRSSAYAHPGVSQSQPHLLSLLRRSLAPLTGLRWAAPALAAICSRSGCGLLPALAMQPLGHLLGVALGVQGQQAGEHVVAHGIGPAVAPGQLAAAGDGAVGLELALEVEGVIGIPKEQLAAVDALLQGIGELGVVFGVEVVEPEAAGGWHIAPAVGGQHHLIHLLVEPAQLQEAAAGFGWIVETVVGAGKSFVVRQHQVGSKRIESFASLGNGVVYKGHLEKSE